jgi:hypothetical protein
MAQSDTPGPPIAEPPRQEISDEPQATILEQVLRGFHGALVGVVCGVLSFYVVVATREWVSQKLFGRHWTAPVKLPWLFLIFLIAGGIYGGIVFGVLRGRASDRRSRYR